MTTTVGYMWKVGPVFSAVGPGCECGWEQSREKALAEIIRRVKRAEIPLDLPIAVAEICTANPDELRRANEKARRKFEDYLAWSLSAGCPRFPISVEVKFPTEDVLEEVRRRVQSRTTRRIAPSSIQKR